LVVIERLPGVGNQRVSKKQCIAAQLYRFVGKVVVAIARYQRDFIKILAAIRHLAGFGAYVVIEPKHVEMANVLPQVFGQVVHFVQVEFFEGLGLRHAAKLRESNGMSLASIQMR
nr:hypothetical protein [Tanacetum cinerariifolium]